MDPGLQYCTPEELLVSAQPNSPLHCFTRNESIALTFWVQSGVLSCGACLVTFGLILRNICYHAKRTPGRWRLVKLPMDVYFLSLFSAEIVLSVGAVLNAKWVADGKLHVGGWCTVQSVTLSIGGINVATSTLAIALHTFIMAWCSKGFHAIKLAWIAISIPWIFSILYFASLGLAHRSKEDAIFRPAPYWCWIGRDYLVERIFGVYFWLWASLLISMIFYLPLALWVRGNITLGDRFWNFRIHKRQRVEDPRGLRRHALNLIAYPIVYSLLILPLSVARWMGFTQEMQGDRKNHIPSTVLLSVKVIYCLSGLANVVLFFLTRPNLLLFGKDVVEVDAGMKVMLMQGKSLDSVGVLDSGVTGRDVVIIGRVPERNNECQWVCDGSTTEDYHV